MRTDAIRVAVRPRSILECLDLATLVCGRRPLAVALATAAGALPCVAVNRLVFAGGGAAAPPLALLALGVEMAWAAVPLTLYLGQAVFSDRFSWRDAARSALGCLPALVVFQGFLRAVCLATVILAPVVFVGMYYLDEVILLERPPLAKTWSRRGAINRRKGGHIVSLALVEGLVLATGTLLGANFLDALARLWRGGLGPAGSATVADGVVPAVMSWSGQIAFWSTCGFLTIFRFFTYLDGRIRREGWDVELKLRAEETYAGLPRVAAPPRARAAAPGPLAVAALAVALAVGATSAAAGDARGAAARHALERQSFPWYDAATDRYRPLIEPSRDPPERSATEREPGSTARRGEGHGRGDGRGGGGAGGSGGGRRGSGGGAAPPPPRLQRPPEVVSEVGRALLIVLLVAAVVGLVVAVVRYGLGSGREPAGAEDAGGDDASADPAPEALPPGIRLAAGDLLARCAAEAERGDFAAAMLLLHAWMLVELQRRGVVALARGKTNGQYAAEVTLAAPELVGLFRASSGLFEDAFFGRLPVSRADFLAVWERRGLVAPAAEPVASVP